MRIEFGQFSKYLKNYVLLSAQDILNFIKLQKKLD